MQTTQNPPNVSWLMWNLEMGHIFFSSQRNMRLQCHGVNDTCIYVCCIIWSSYVLSRLWNFTKCTKTHPIRDEKGEIHKYCSLRSCIFLFLRLDLDFLQPKKPLDVISITNRIHQAFTIYIYPKFSIEIYPNSHP